MRGTWKVGSDDFLGEGLIPAHAGNTAPHQTGKPTSRAHPRACGEHVIAPTLLEDIRGSSPRMRGAPALAVNGVHFVGLIPAHAGSTAFPDFADSFFWAHPRACGEHSAKWANGNGNWGSSPRMRGARQRSWRRHGARRLIPAHAGSTGPNH